MPTSRARKGKGKGKMRVVQPAVAQPDPVAEDVTEATDDSSSVSSDDNFDTPLDVDPVEQSVIADGHPNADLEQSQMPFTAGQLAVLQQTIQQSVTEALCSHRSQVVPDTVQSLHPFPSV